MVDGDEMSPRTRPDPTLCYLCGEPIGRVTASMDHVPPARFFPTALRPTLRRPLLTLRTHPACHSGWDREEEYFYNGLLPSVLDAPLGPSLAADFRASQRHPENRRLAETVRRQFERNPGGLHLPPGLLVQRFDGARLTAVAWKIVRGLFFEDNGRAGILPDATPRLVEFYGPHDQTAPAPVLAVMGEPSRGRFPQVLDYKVFTMDEPPTQAWDLLLWDRFVVFVLFHWPGRCRCADCAPRGRVG